MAQSCSRQTGKYQRSRLAGLQAPSHHSGETVSSLEAKRGREEESASSLTDGTKEAIMAELEEGRKARLSFIKV